MGHNLGNNYGKFYSFLSKPVLADCNFVVDSTNGNGLGQRQLKGQGVKQVFMHTTAAFTGTSHTSTLIDGIASGTASLKVGMPVQGSGIPTGATIAAILSSGSISLSVATSSSTTGSITYQGVGSPNPAVGYAWVQLAYNYKRYYGGAAGFISPVTGSNIAINSTSLSVGTAYEIVSVGHAAAGAVTIAPVADVSGSLASTWFNLFDAYGNTFVIWFSVSGVGSAPVGVSGTLVQQTISTGATAAQIGAALVTTLNALPAQQPGNPTAPAGVFSFTATGTTTVTATNTSTAPYELPGGPKDGAIATGFTFALSVNDSNRTDWQNVGLPAGVVPAVGASFIAKATGSGSSTGLVQAAGVSGIIQFEVIGDPNASIAPVPFRGSPNSGGWLLIQFLGATSTSVTTLIPTAPAAGSVCSLQFYLEEGTEVGGNGE